MTMISLDQAELDAPLPTPSELEALIPCTDEHATFVLHARETIEAILNGWDPRRLLIIGPCSIHDLDAAREYAFKFKALSEKVSDQFFMVMRTYFEKPRTIKGWKGLLNDPDLDNTYNLAKGVRLARQLLVELTEMGVPSGCELLEMNTSHYYTHFLSWGCIGARTCASPPHRQLAASLTLPIGFKNSTEGCIDHPIHGILSASLPHVYVGISSSGQMQRIHTQGNPLCHVVLRGGVKGANYHPNHIAKTVQKCRQARIRDKLVIDCSHDNSGKQHTMQIPVFESLIQQILAGNEHIAGVMLESHLNAGSQRIGPNLRYGVSVTDPCLDWESTERLILQAHSQLTRSSVLFTRDCNLISPLKLF